jgi:hypothetical protein
MASISESLIQGLLQPSLNFQNLQEPLGMILGGARAQRARDERQKGLMTQALGAQDMSALQNLMSRARTPEEAKMVFEAGQAGRASKEQEKAAAAAEEEQKRVKNLRAEAVAKASQGKDPNFTRAIANAPEEVLQEYLFSGASVDPKTGYLVVGNNLFDANTKDWVTVPESAQEQEKDQWFFSSDGTKRINRRTGAVELVEEGEGASANVLGDVMAINNVIDVVDQTLSLVEGEDVNPYLYDALKYIPMTGEKSVANLVNTIQANLAFDRLDQMRKESKTGGALGSIAVRELELLKDSVRALDPADKNFKENLREVIRQYKDFRNALLGKPPESDKYIVDEKDGKKFIYYVDTTVDKNDENRYISLGEFNAIR